MECQTIERNIQTKRRKRERVKLLYSLKISFDTFNSNYSTSIMLNFQILSNFTLKINICIVVLTKLLFLSQKRENIVRTDTVVM